MKDFFLKYEAILATVVGAIPSFAFAIVPANTCISFSLFLVIITILLIIIWFLYVSRSRATKVYADITLTVTHLDWQTNKMKFLCNVDNNILTKDLCITLYYMENGLSTTCGVGRITEYDSVKRIAQAQIIPVPNYGGSLTEHFPSMENLRLSPMVDYDMINNLVSDIRRNENV